MSCRARKAPTSVDGQGGDDRIQYKVDISDPGSIDDLNGGPNRDVIEILGTDADDEMTVQQLATTEHPDRTTFRVDRKTGSLTASFEFSLPVDVEQRDIEFLRVSGGAGNDVIRAVGSFNVNQLQMNGGDGNDTLEGADGEELLYGGAGDDLLLGGDGRDELHGGGDDDTLHGGNHNDALFGEDGNDTLYGNEGADVLYGGGGSDRLEAGNDLVGDIMFGDNDEDDPDGGNDTMIGGDGVDIMFGGPGDDLLEGHGQSDVLFGEGDDDTLRGGTGHDVLVGGAGDNEFQANPPGETDDETASNWQDVYKKLLAREVATKGDIDWIEGRISELKNDAEEDGPSVDEPTPLESSSSAIQEVSDELDRLEQELTFLGNALVSTNLAQDAVNPYQTVQVDVIVDDDDEGQQRRDSNSRFVGNNSIDVNELSTGLSLSLQGQPTVVFATNPVALVNQYRRFDSDVQQAVQGIFFTPEAKSPDELSAQRSENVMEIKGSSLSDDIRIEQLETGMFRVEFRDPQTDNVITVLEFAQSGDPTAGESDIDVLRVEGLEGDDQIQVIGQLNLSHLELSGGDGNDLLKGSDGIDIMFGGEGDDTLEGYGHNDVLLGESGHDILSGGWGRDVLAGGRGNDTLYAVSENETEEPAPSVGSLSPYGDIDMDGIVGFSDFVILSDNFGLEKASSVQGDIDGDGAVGFSDFVILADNFGATQLESPASDGTDEMPAGWAAIYDSLMVRELETFRALRQHELDGSAEEQLQHLANELVMVNLTQDEINPYQTIQADILIGGAGDDWLRGSEDMDRLIAGSGNDVIEHTGGGDHIDGGRNALVGDTADGLVEHDQYLVSGTEDSDEIAVRLQEGDEISAPQVVVDVNGVKTLVSHPGIEVAGVRALGGDDTVTVQLGRNPAVNVDVDGGEGHDTLDAKTYGFDGNATLRGGRGDDTLNGGNGDDTLDGGDGNDTLTGANGNDVLKGGSGTDVLSGDEGDDTIVGGDGNDALTGADGNDVLNGGSGDDVLSGGAGVDSFNGGLGKDRLVESWASSTSGVKIEFVRPRRGWSDPLPRDNSPRLPLPGPFQLPQGNIGQLEQAEVTRGTSRVPLPGSALARERTDEFEQVELPGGAMRTLPPGSSQWIKESVDQLEQAKFTGGAGDDVIDTSSFDFSVVLIGGAGNDVLTGGNRNDQIDGGEGNDRITGGAGSDILVAGPGSDHLVDIVSGNSALGETQLSSGEGTDVISDFEKATLNGTAANDRIDARTFEHPITVNGGAGDDTILGTGHHDVLNGDAGDDWVYGYGGNDRLAGGAGADSMYGGIGNDSLSGNDGADLLEGDLGNDTLNGGEHNDSLYAGSGHDLLLGGSGDDRLEGEGGNDELNGDSGTDRLSGGSGNDELDGGNDGAKDTLHGGSGADTFRQYYKVDEFLYPDKTKGTRDILEEDIEDSDRHNGDTVETIGVS